MDSTESRSGQALEHGQEMTQEQDDAERDERDADDRDELCQGEHHLGLCRADIAPRLGRQLCRIALRADMRQLHTGAAGDDEAAGLQRVARIFQNGIGLASQQRLIDLQLAVAHDSVRADLVARRKFHDVIADKLIPSARRRAGRSGWPSPFLPRRASAYRRRA